MDASIPPPTLSAAEPRAYIKTATQSQQAISSHDVQGVVQSQLSSPPVVHQAAARCPLCLRSVCLVRGSRTSRVSLFEHNPLDPADYHSEEVGYPSGAIEKKVVNLVEGANFTPEFLHLVCLNMGRMYACTNKFCCRTRRRPSLLCRLMARS